MVNINKFNTAEASNVPKRHSLRDPFSGDLIMDEDENTLDFYVYGVQSDIARNAQRARQRKWGTDKKLTDDEAAQAGAEYLAALTQGWSKNVAGDDGPIEFSREAAVQLYLDQDWIARQVIEFATNLRNYDPKAGSVSARGSGGSRGSTQSRSRAKTPESEPETAAAGGSD